jgi:FkbM family methyltransferase
MPFDYLISALRPFQFRGKARLLNPITPVRGIVNSRVFRATFELDLGDFIQRQIYMGTFERQETQALSRYLRPGMTFADVGANVGYFTALAANRCGAGGRVFAFEPSPYAFSRLSSMIFNNGLLQCKPLQLGLSSTSGISNLYLGCNSRNHTPTMVPHENSNAISISINTLDNIAERFAIDIIDCMKLDVEGHEIEILKGSKCLLEGKRIRAILCEFNDAWLEKTGETSQSLEFLLACTGFKEISLGRRTANRFFVLP